MPVDTIKQRLADICSDMTGIKYAQKNGPRNTSDFPAVIVLTGAAEYVRISNDVGQETRQYNLALLVMPWAQGVEGEAEELTEPFYQRFRDTFGARPGLWRTVVTDALQGVQDAWLTNDPGTTNLVLAGTSYAGVMFTVSVEELYDLGGRGY